MVRASRHLQCRSWCSCFWYPKEDLAFTCEWRRDGNLLWQIVEIHSFILSFTHSLSIYWALITYQALFWAPRTQQWIKHCLRGAYIRVQRWTKWDWESELDRLLGKKIEIAWEVGELKILGKVTWVRLYTERDIEDLTSHSVHCSESNPDAENSKCKGLEAEICLECSRTNM